MQLDTNDFMLGGYHSDSAKSGITAVFPMKPNVAGISQHGGSPGTMETDILRPLHRKNNSVDAVGICGRSIFGFTAVQGIIKRMRENGAGFQVGNIRVPIVPAAAIFDFVDNEEMPEEKWGDLAYESRSKSIRTGLYWAGRGATVGKIRGVANCTPSGQGFSQYRKGGLYVGVLTVLNAFGDIRNGQGEIIAGARDENGKFVDSIEYAKTHGVTNSRMKVNTTVGVLITNLVGDTSTMGRMAEACNLGYASRIYPYSTSYDGDTVFAVSTNEVEEDIDLAMMIARSVASDSVISVFQ